MSEHLEVLVSLRASLRVWLLAERTLVVEGSFVAENSCCDQCDYSLT